LPDDREAVQLLIPLLNDANVYYRNEVAFALASVAGGSNETLPLLLAVARDRSNSARLRAIESISKLGSEAATAVPALVPLLHEDPEVAWRAAEALGKIGAPARVAVPALQGALQRGESEVRTAAAVALWKLGRQTDKVVAVLIETLTAPAPAALENDLALPAYYPQPVYTPRRLPDLSRRRRSFPPYYYEPAQIAVLREHDFFRRWAVRTLGEMGPEAQAATPALREVLRDAEGELRQLAAAALEHIDGKTPVGGTR
jgi:HEAT repeat protein